jgi:O-acetyl-ADP-ribose deacetylase (regulator of RNase III)
MIKVTGDLLKLAIEGKFDIICHQANCYHTMGSGIAKQIREQFPEAYKVDLATPKGDSSKLGTFSVAKVTRGTSSFLVANLYGQHSFGRGIQTNYSALRSCFEKLKETYGNKKLRFGIPSRIACGLGGGSWDVVSKIIEDELEGEDVTLVEYNGTSFVADYYKDTIDKY